MTLFPEGLAPVVNYTVHGEGYEEATALHREFLQALAHPDWEGYEVAMWLDRLTKFPCPPHLHWFGEHLLRQWQDRYSTPSRWGQRP